MLPHVFESEDFPYTMALKNTIHGPMYQVNVIIACMFECYEANVDFSLMSEHGGFEKFDDIVFKKAGEAETQLVQIKHGKNLGALYEINDFARDTGKEIELPMYFDAWHNIISRDNFESYEFVLFSNHVISSKKKFELCFNSEGSKFLKSFINYEPKDITNTEKITKPPKNATNQEVIHWHSERIFRSIFQRSKAIKDNNMSRQQAISSIRDFLKTITFRLGQPGLEVLVNDNKSRLKKRFAVNNDAIYFAWYAEVEDWIRRENVQSYTLSSIRHSLRDIYEQFYTIQRWFALTQRRLENITDKIGDKALPRTNQITKLNTIIKRKAFQVVIIEGEPGSGKSGLIKQYYQQAHCQEGDVVFLDLQELKEKDLVALRQSILKVIILDNIEEALYRRQDKAKIMKLLSFGKEHGKKIIFICQTQEVNHLIETCKLEEIHSNISQIEIGLLTNQELRQLLSDDIYKILSQSLKQETSDQPSSDDQERRMSPDRYKSVYDFLVKAPMRHSVFVRNEGHFSMAEDKLIRTPFYLNLIYQRWNEIRSGQKPSTDLSGYIVKLAIEGVYSDHPIHYVKAKHRMKVLIHLVITLSQQGETSVFFKTFYTEALTALIKDQIILSNPDSSLSLGHQIYKNWIIRYYSSQIIKEALIEKQHPFTLIKRLVHVFSHHTFVWLRVFHQYENIDKLFDIEALEELHIVKSEYELPDFDQFDFIKKCAILAIILNKPKILKSLFVGFLNIEEALNENLLTFFDLSIECNSRAAMEVLVQVGANIINRQVVVYNVNNQPVVEYDDDPPYDLDSDNEGDLSEMYDLHCEEEHRPDKYFLRTRRYDYASRSRIDAGIQNASDEKPHDFKRERIHRAPYLIRAIYNSEVKTIKFLITLIKKQSTSEEGISITRIFEYRNNFEETALHAAVLQEEPTIVSLLLKEGHPINVVDIENETPLHNAIYQKNREIFDLLLDELKNNEQLDQVLNQKNICGWTPLHLAILTHQQDMILRLVELGANSTIEDEANNTPEVLIDKVNENNNLALYLPEVSDDEDEELDHESNENNSEDENGSSRSYSSSRS